MRRTLLTIGAMLAMIAPGCSGQDPDGCFVDEDCPAGFFCREATTECDFDCTRDSDCPAGFACSIRGRCERGCVQTNGGREACDGLDNDCDESTDEDFAELGQPCDRGGCTGVWICASDGSTAVCDAPEPAEDDATCDGRDDDCDGATDEDALEKPCDLQQGICAGATSVCLESGEWSDCDYGPDHTPGVDQACDGVDSDCDGQTDEDAAPVLVPESGQAAGDGRDNNCNGLVDEAGGVMVPVPLQPGVFVDAFEATIFDNPGCEGTPQGVDGDDYPPGWPADGPASVALFACSLPDVIPSGHLSWHRADRACQAQGKRLCRSSWWRDACGDGNWFPYAAAFASGICNDAWQSGGVDDGQVAATGRYAGCTAGIGTFDMSGNLAEWIQEWDEEVPLNAHTGGFHYLCELCTAGIWCHPCVPGDDTDALHVEWTSRCHPGIRPEGSFPRSAAQAYLGARCCLEIP